MHLGRFHSAVRELNDYYSALAIVEALSSASAQMQAYASSKELPQLQVFRAKLHELASAIENVPSSFNLPSVTELFNDLNVGDWHGAALALRIRATMNSSGMLPEEIVKSLDSLKTTLTQVISDVSGIEERLRRREVETVMLGEDEAEFGVAFPRELVGETAEDLVSEINHVNRLFKSLNALMGRGTESPKVRTIASSWWQVFVQLDAAQIALWTVAIERIVQLIKTGYEIRKLKKDLEERKDIVPDNFVPELEARLLNTFKMGVAELASTLRQSCQPTADEGTVNELEIQLKQELLHLVRRVNGGAVLELRIGTPKEFPPSEDGTDDAHPEAIQQRERHVAKLSERVQLNAKLADLSGITAKIELREDLKLEGPAEQDPPAG